MKKAIAIIVLCAVLLSCTAAADSWPEWAEPVKDWAIEEGIGEAFISAPYMQVSRAQAAQLLYEAAGKPEVSSEPPFTDTPEQYADAIAWAASEGIIDGVSEDKYEPSRPVAREEFAAILYRAAGRPDADENALDAFADAGSISAYAIAPMSWCVANGVMDGKTEDSLSPRDTIIVAEATAMLQRSKAVSGDVETLKVSSIDEIKSALRSAIIAAEQPPVFDVSALGEVPELEIDVQNLYNAILSESPELKYAYELELDYSGGLLKAEVSYMPYRTGRYPAGFEGIRVESLSDLINAAEANLGKSSVKIYIADRSLTVDDMSMALQQAGGSYILCQLNRDATEITFTPLNDLSMSEAVDMLDEIDGLADAVFAECVDEGMTKLEKAEALYTYLTENVKYDHRYYSDRPSMPYDSQTAYGALHDNLAICGGYAQALQQLFQKAGIPCYTVSGEMGSEYHMWNIAYLDGEWRYFDATSDRGRADYWFNCFNVGADDLTRYVWDRDFTELLTQADI